MRKIFYALPGLALLLFIAAPVSAVPEAPADGLKMEQTKKTVVFDHSVHKQHTQCSDCHHPVNGAENYQKCATAGCHDGDRADKSVHGYFRAIHGKNLKFKSCVACHQEYAAAHPDMKKAMTSCKGSKCHP